MKRSRLLVATVLFSLASVASAQSKSSDNNEPIAVPYGKDQRSAASGEQAATGTGDAAKDDAASATAGTLSNELAELKQAVIALDKAVTKVGTETFNAATDKTSEELKAQVHAADKRLEELKQRLEKQSAESSDSMRHSLAKAFYNIGSFFDEVGDSVHGNETKATDETSTQP